MHIGILGHAFLKKRQSHTRGLLDALVAPTFAAHGHIAVVAANLHLLSLLDKIAIAVDTGIDYGFTSAVAGRFYLVDCVRYFKRRREPSKRWLWKSVRKP